MKDEIYDVAIIGSGPAGLTAAIYTTRGAASTVVFAGYKWGGQLMLTSVVDNFPGFPDGIEGPNLMQNMRRQAEKFGAEIVEANTESIDFDKAPFEIASAGKLYKAKTIIIATGSDTKWLNVPGEKEFIGRGVATCAPCDAPFYKDKIVAVVGGGDSAMEEALVLTKYASKVYLIHRRNEFKAYDIMQKKVFTKEKEGKIEIIWDAEVKEIIGKKKVENIKILEKSKGKESELAVDGVFVAIGHIPVTEIFKGKIDLDEKGYVKRAGEQESKRVKEFKTAVNIPGVFVAGDVEDHTYKQAITAAGFGCQAALDCLRYLDEQE
jgi:thioredoxin reductase (NADPH)